jgi:Ca2+-binding RTX toxin-like protein
MRLQTKALYVGALAAVMSAAVTAPAVAVPGPGQAEVGYDGSAGTDLFYIANAKDKRGSNLAVTFDGQQYIFRDSDVELTTDLPNSGCTVYSSSEVRCAATHAFTSTTGVDIYLFGGSDHVMATVPVPVVMDGGNGIDDLRSAQSGAVLLGGAGDDYLASAGAYKLDGGSGKDFLDGKTGGGSLTGGDGDDRIYGGASVDTIDGGGGADFIVAGLGADHVTGGDGSDEIHGDSGNDSIDGGANGDKIYSESGDDTVRGGDGGDTIIGGKGDDLLSGEGGNDVLHGDKGKDTVKGNSGNDKLFSRDSQADVDRCGDGTDTASIDSLDAINSCETTTT